MGEERSVSPPASVSTADVRGPGGEPPARLGRFVLLEPLGSGGMGSVYSAWDRQLERRVALKILHHGDRVRSLREAQALARLHHPNVVTVHDAGSAEGFDFIAMELVEGRSLRAWLRQPRSWREVVAVFRQAGRGLAAAHAAGLVHRDFKPENVLIADNGAVRVADFGLARSSRRGVHETSAPGRAHSTLLGGVLTQPGVVVGTKRYMAPEQEGGGPPDPRMDQYGFAVSLWEALFGCHPDESQPATLGGAALRPATGRVPAWLRAVLKRALAVSPSARFRSMDALLAALGRDASRTRSLAVAALGGAVLLALVVRPEVATPPPCRGSADRLAGVWDPAVKDAMRQAFLASGRGHAVETFARAATVLDQRGDAWVAMRTDACEATAVRHEQSALLLDLRMQCLDHRLAELRALTRLLAHADAPLVDNAVTAVRQLGALEPCADARALLDAVPPPADAAARAHVLAIRDQLARAEALFVAGRYRETEALATGLVAAARAVGHAPVIGEALLVLGQTQMDLYEDAAARLTLEEALRTLAAAKDDVRVVETWIHLINVLGIGLSRPAEALALRPGAEAALARAGGQPRLRALLLTNLGKVVKQQGKLDEALELQRSALAIELAALDPADLMIASTHNSIGVLLKNMDRYAEASTELEQALALYRRVLGPEHPNVAGALMNIGAVDQLEGRYADSVTALGRALAIQERTLGPEQPEVAVTLGWLGTARELLGDLAGARADFERSLAIAEKKLPPDHLSLAMSLVNSADILVVFGEAERARTLTERALAIYRGNLDADDPRVARALTTLGLALAAEGQPDLAGAAFVRALAIEAHDEGGVNDGTAAAASALARLRVANGRAAEALPLAERAVAIRARLHGGDDHLSARALTVEAEVLLALHRRDEAAPLAERAVGILERHDGAPIELAEARFDLARALAGSDARRARDLAAGARALLAGAGPPGATELARVDTWMRSPAR